MGVLPEFTFATQASLKEGENALGVIWLLPGRNGNYATGITKGVYDYDIYVKD